MDILKNYIIDICHNHYKYLLNLQNVNSIGFGYKKINGITSKEICLNVFVDEKISEKYLSQNNIIPKNYMGIKTDVIQTGKIIEKAKTNELIPQKARPLVGGLSISVGADKIEGTLGCIVVKKSLFKTQYFILSNNHVLANNNLTPIGTTVIQPSEKINGVFPNDVVANLSDFVPIKLSESTICHVNLVDCAIAKLQKNSLATKEIYKIGKINGISKATLGLNIKKVGFVSGLTYGTVIATNVTTKIYYKKKLKYYTDQIKSNLFNDFGDSGSLILDDKNRAVGLLMSGSVDGSITIFNDISLVLKSLKVKLYM